MLSPVLPDDWYNRKVQIANRGEMLAQFAKETKAAILIGKRTRGNVLGLRSFRVEAVTGFTYQGLAG
jgi:hypothetical protein